VRYAFGAGLDPRKKDGVRAHPIVFAGGVLLHIAIFSAAAWLVLMLAAISLPPLGHIMLAAAFVAGILAGFGLLVRRCRSPVLRVVSLADDYTSILLVIGFLGAAEWSLLTPAGAPAFLLVSAALAAYAPFSKIRHCVLFFVTRWRFAMFVGKRGVLGTRAGRA
jgi:hypothetical protein